MGDLFGTWIDPNQLVHIEPPENSIAGLLAQFLRGGYARVGLTLNSCIREVVHARSQHIFLFLTKNPAGYKIWGEFPDNVWLGTSVCSDADLTRAITNRGAMRAKHTWLSIEPLFGSLQPPLEKRLQGWDWLVIGAQSGSHAKQPQISWVKEIVEGCDKAGISVWLKDNLRPLFIPEDCRKPNALTIDSLWANEKCQLRQQRPFAPASTGG
jgi:protein gp37